MSVASSVCIREITDVSAEPAVRGFLHVPNQANGDGLALTHGAGANCRSKLLTALAGSFAAGGVSVLRFDLPFRQHRPQGPPFPGSAVRDRDGLRRAVQVLQETAPGRIYLGGHSYGGRQASMLAAEENSLVAGLILLSYPLHPPRKPLELRTGHFPRLAIPTLFVQGSRDPFGSLEELNSALKLIPARRMLLEIPGSGHELLPRNAADEVPARIVGAFQSFFS
jgi:predicted alpha/beta-hydrolase family hydrolase